MTGGALSPQPFAPGSFVDRRFEAAASRRAGVLLREMTYGGNSTESYSPESQRLCLHVRLGLIQLPFRSHDHKPPHSSKVRRRWCREFLRDLQCPTIPAAPHQYRVAATNSPRSPRRTLQKIPVPLSVPSNSG